MRPHQFEPSGSAHLHTFTPSHLPSSTYLHTCTPSKLSIPLQQPRHCSSVPARRPCPEPPQHASAPLANKLEDGNSSSAQGATSVPFLCLEQLVLLSMPASKSITL
eukprot:1126118-Pelagomonas_calceolata.AAC.2